jgi:ribonucleotide reductase alpha subunit
MTRLNWRDLLMLNEIIKYKEIIKKYEDMTTEKYFNENKFSIDAFNKKYRLHENETYPCAVKRVCDYMASVEKTEQLKEYWSLRWQSELLEDWWHPAGSIMQGAGSGRKISLANCTTISMGSIDEKNEWDNLESIFKNGAYTVAKTAAYRQGLGVDFSRLRPKGSAVLNSANESTGAIHWMKLIDSIGYYVGQKGRIPAMLFSLNIKHPDIEEFITVKSDYTKIQNANISVQIVNSFYTAVYNDDDWDLSFELSSIKKGQKIYVDVHSTDKDCIKELVLPHKEGDPEQYKYYKIATHDKKGDTITRKVKARKLLELIADNMFNNAEPGIQNIDIAREYSNSDAVYDPKDEYDSRIISTNACCIVGESKIMTDRGWISIEEIYDKIHNNEQFLVMSYNILENKYEFKPILNAWQQRNDVTVTLEIEENSKLYKIECSSDHKVLTRNRGYVEAASLTEDDDIIIYNT